MGLILIFITSAYVSKDLSNAAISKSNNNSGF
jgi:hypothetical protein